MLGSYEKQQRRMLDEFGGDDEEVASRVGRMREWLEFCRGETRDAMRDAKFVELFGKPEHPKIETMSPHSKCQRCLGAGLYWSDGCTPRKRNPGHRSVAGFVVCSCEGGRIKNTAILKHGMKKDAPKRGPVREEF